MSDSEKPKTLADSYKNPHGKTPWSRAGATTAFKAINPELFIKPNKFTSVIGLIALTGCVAFMGYLHAMDENRKDVAEGKAYRAVDEEGKYNQVHKRHSRWE